MTSWKNIFAALSISAVVAFGAAGNALAQIPVTDNLPKEATATDFDPVEHKRVLGISEQLRCLVCQNQSIADSNAELAVDLRNQVIEQINAGRTDKEIIDYMVERYGDFVLYNPPFKASTVILWVGPIVLFLGALLAFYINIRRRKSAKDVSPKSLSPDEMKKAEELLRMSDK